MWLSVYGVVQGIGVCVCSIYLSGCLSVHGVIGGYAAGGSMCTRRNQRNTSGLFLYHLFESGHLIGSEAHRLARLPGQGASGIYCLRFQCSSQTPVAMSSSTPGSQM